MCVLALQSVFEESLPRPSVEAVRGEMMPSCFVLQPVRGGGRDATRVIYLLQVRLWDPHQFVLNRWTKQELPLKNLIFKVKHLMPML